MTDKAEDQRTREGQILSSAQRCFAERGFHQTTIDMIAEAAGVGKGTIYLYFASKKDLMITLMERRSSEMQAMIEEAVEAGRTTAEKLKGLVKAHFEFYLKHKEYVLLVYTHLGELAEDMKDRFIRSRHDLDRLLQDVLQQGIDEGEIRPASLEFLHHSLQGIIHSNAFEWALGNAQTPPDVLSDWVYELFCQGAGSRGADSG